MRAVTRAVKDFYKTHPNAASYKDIRNSSGNLYQHIKDVVKSAQEIPVPEGYTRQELVQAALFHDIGKVFERGRSHDKVSAEMLDDLGINVSDNVKHSVKHHMS
jgi:putative nucleotidyltransferase with HDIG domain